MGYVGYWDGCRTLNRVGMLLLNIKHMEERKENESEARNSREKRVVIVLVNANANKPSMKQIARTTLLAYTARLPTYVK